MRVVIIEDEKPAARRLASLLNELDARIEVLAQLASVKQSIAWFRENEVPDLCFMDIQLSDGLSFDIMDVVALEAPIIFTTAYDQYALQAFRVNSIDYLLKPIAPEELSAALEKYQARFSSQQPTPQPDWEHMQNAMAMLTRRYKSRFMVKVGERIQSFPIEEIGYFFSQEKATYLQTLNGKRYMIDHPLDRLEELVDPHTFFRLNRKYLSRVQAIDDIATYSSSRLKVKLQDCDDEDIIVSYGRVREFKEWLDS